MNQFNSKISLKGYNVTLSRQNTNLCYFLMLSEKRDIMILQRNAEKKTILRRCCRVRVIIIFAVVLAVGIGIDKLTTKNADRESGQSRKKYESNNIYILISKKKSNAVRK